LIADELEAPLSPIRCFVPISAQCDSEIDYLQQFRIAPVRKDARQTGARKRRKKQKGRKIKATKRRKLAQSDSKQKIFSCAKTFEDFW
jgi:hypothetical protein